LLYIHTTQILHSLPEKSTADFQSYCLVVTLLPPLSPMNPLFAQSKSQVWRSLSPLNGDPRGTNRAVKVARPNRASGMLKLKGRLENGDPFDENAESSGFDPNFRNAYADDFRLRRFKQGERVEIAIAAPRFDSVIKLINARTGRTILYGDNRGFNLNSQAVNTNSRLTFTVQPKTKYLLRISSLSARETGNYKIKLRYVQPASSDFDFFYGSGLVNAAAAVARVTGREASSFPSVNDVGGLLTRLDVVQAPEVWAQGYTGQGITIAIIDDGVDYTHPDLRNNIWNNSKEIANNGIDDDRNGFVDDIRGWNFVENNNDPSDLSTDGHGTHVAGTAAASQGSATGVAYNAKIMPIRVIGNQGAFDTDIAQGIRYAVNNGAKVINMSLGGDSPILAPELTEALLFAKQEGVTVLIASGNERQSDGAIKPGNPALFAASQDLGIAIGAVDDRRFLFEDGNPAGNQQLNFVVAPGVSVRSTLPSGDYGFLSGTSMSTAHVSGVVALMLSANPNLTPAQVREILMATSDRNVRQAV
jgi:subtilisin family serine protease